MPTYDYACTACQHRFEVVQAFTDDSLTECPECQGRLRKLFGSVGVVFKGSGFYRTDSRADSKAGPGRVGSSAAEKGGSAASAASNGSGTASTASTSAGSTSSGSTSSGSTQSSPSASSAGSKSAASSGSKT